MQKSIGSNDTAHSESSTVPQTTTVASNSHSSSSGGDGGDGGSGSSNNQETEMRENGNGDVNHVHGSTGNGSVDGSGANNNEQTKSQGLNLKMSAKELRAQLAARKKYDPKKESIGFKDKFDIVQKL